MEGRGAILVTGGAGYVGSHVARALAKVNRDVVVLDDLSTGRREHLKWGRFVEGRVEDDGLVRKTCKEHGVTAVVHLAGRISVEESVRDPAGYFAANVEATRALARSVAAEGVRNFIFSSSAAVYGEPVVVPIPESHRTAPTSPYGESKIAAEHVLQSSGLVVAILRYFNAAGAACGDGIGERHDPETHLIPLAIEAAVSGKPLHLFGDDYQTPDGTCLRDYVHVEDLADAHVAALERLESSGGGGTWNLGGGNGASVREVTSAVERATKRPVPARIAPRRAGDSAVLVADVAKARRDLGFAPRKSSLDRIVSDAWAFRRSRGARP